MIDQTLNLQIIYNSIFDQIVTLENNLGEKVFFWNYTEGNVKLCIKKLLEIIFKIIS